MPREGERDIGRGRCVCVCVCGVTEFGVFCLYVEEGSQQRAHSHRDSQEAVPAANSDLSAGKMAALSDRCRQSTVVIFNRTAAQWAERLEMQIQVKI